MAPENKYLYNGKELNGDYEINLMDYGARWYDGAIGRFTGVDPLASERSWVSPYNYVQNNPILRIDPTGALDWIYDQQEDGSYQRREGVENDGGENHHTFHNNDGTTTYVNTKEGTCVTVCQDEINQQVDELEVTKVHQIGITAAAGSPGGLTLSGGFAWDSKGNLNPYGNIGFFHGLEVTAGVEYTQSRSKTNDSDFSIYSLEGTGVNYNGGLFFIDAGFGSDTQGNGNYSENKEATYNSYSGGLSLGIPIGASRSVEQTKIFRLFGN